jgi:hypothetical protein
LVGWLGEGGLRRCQCAPWCRASVAADGFELRWPRAILRAALAAQPSMAGGRRDLTAPARHGPPPVPGRWLPRRARCWAWCALLPSREASRAAPGRGELAAFARTSEVSVKARLQEHLDLAARGAPSLPELAERLAQQGLRMRAHVATTGRLSGLSFELDGVSCKGSDLGRGYSWQGLARRARLHYEPARDLPRLRALGAVPAPEVTPARPAVEPEQAMGVDHARESPAPVREDRSPARSRSGESAPAPARAAIGAADTQDLRQQLREAVDRAARGAPTLPEFAERLSAAGVRVHANLASTGRLSGLSFAVEGVRWKGSELGRDYAWKALAARHGIGYEPARDLARLERLAVAPRREPYGAACAAAAAGGAGVPGGGAAQLASRGPGARERAGGATRSACRYRAAGPRAARGPQTRGALGAGASRGSAPSAVDDLPGPGVREKGA